MQARYDRSHAGSDQVVRAGAYSARVVGASSYECTRPRTALSGWCCWPPAAESHRDRVAAWAHRPMVRSVTHRCSHIHAFVLDFTAPSRSRSWVSLVGRGSPSSPTKKLLHRSHRSVRELNTDICAWITGWTNDPRPTSGLRRPDSVPRFDSPSTGSALVRQDHSVPECDGDEENEVFVERRNRSVGCSGKQLRGLLANGRCTMAG
jgi:hypothetical protein